MRKEVMQQVLDALCNHPANYKLNPAELKDIHIAVDALLEAITQPEPVAQAEQPVGYFYKQDGGWKQAHDTVFAKTNTPLFIAPQPAAPVAQAEPLSELEIIKIIGHEFPLPLVEPKIIKLIESVCRGIEAAHGIGKAMQPKAVLHRGQQGAGHDRS